MNERLKILFEQYYRGVLSSTDFEEFRSLLAGASEEEIKQLVTEAEGQRSFADRYFTPEQGAKMLSAILKKRPVVRRIYWTKVAAAAVIIFAIVTAVLVVQQKNRKTTQAAPPVAAKDVKAPIKNRATITLSDGKKLFLDSAGNGQLAVQNNIKLIKLADGQIAYQTPHTNEQAPLTYNTVSNPRGSKVIDLTLADGSRVWLNAGSSVTFPVAFTGRERKVSITGEAYFEVAHDASKPFIVSKGEMSVQVLGTHFNVNAYDDEEAIKVTLLEGSVQVQTAKGKGQTAIIRPGQQARITESIKVTDNVDLDEVMAWKNGKFQFGSKTDLASIMRQLARWYDVNVQFQNGVPSEQFGGAFPRSSSLSEVLEILKTSGVQFRIEGKKLIVINH